jgi:hypothetical protein
MPPPPVLGKLPAASAAAAFVSSPRLEPSTSSNKLLYDLDAIATTPPKKKNSPHTLSLSLPETTEPRRRSRSHRIFKAAPPLTRRSDNKTNNKRPTADFLFLSYTIKSQIQASNQMHHHPQQQQQIHERHRHHSWIPTTTTSRWSIPKKKKKKKKEKKPTNSDTLHDNGRKQPGNLWLP